MGLVQIHYIVIIVESLLYDSHFLHYYFSFVEPFHEVNFYMLAFNFEINCLHPPCYCHKCYMLSSYHDDSVSFFFVQIYFQDLSCSKSELKLSSSSCSPVIDPHLSSDGTMIAFVRDCELHVLNLLINEQRQLTHGANGNTVVSANLSVIARGNICCFKEISG